jgi:hypothetical protein
VTGRLGTEQRAQLINEATARRGGGDGGEPAWGPVPWLDAPMVRLDMGVHVAVGPVRSRVPEDMPHRAGEASWRSWA